MKKILVLGGNTTEYVVVEHAQKLGYYTIVTDSHENWLLSPAKEVADEAWNISWSDIDTLVPLCRQSCIDGVIAGFSEFRVENMIKLCEILDLPCWLTMEQLNLTRDKIKFKQLCVDYEIPCVPEYKYDEVSKYPVIIKPVDRAGSIGINVAYNEDQFKKYYEYAQNMSPSKKVIIEEYIDDGVKFDVYYFIQNESISLLGTSDTVMCKQSKGNETLQKAWIYPSKHQARFMALLDAKLQKLIKGIGLRDGYITMSAFYRNNSFLFFEAGFRLSGEMSFDYFNAVTGQNYLNVLLRYTADDTFNNPRIQALPLDTRYKAITLNFYGVDGVVHTISDINAFMEQEEVISFIVYVTQGQTIKRTGPFKKLAMCTICSKNKAKLFELAKNIYECFDITNQYGESLILEKSDNSLF